MEQAFLDLKVWPKGSSVRSI